MVNKHMKRCSTSIIMRETYNYNEISPHSGQNGHYQKVLQTINAGEGMEKREGNLLHCQCECKLIQPLWKTVWRFIKKLGIKLLCVCICAKSLQSCLTLYDPMDCSLPGSSAHEILWARILEWVAMSYSRGSSRSNAQACSSCGSCIAGGFFTAEVLQKP